MAQASFLQEKRVQYKPLIPLLLKDLNQVSFKELHEKQTQSEDLRKYFPNTWGQQPFFLEKGGEPERLSLTVGVLFSGGPAAGGHNVIAALFDGLQQINPKSKLIGFLGGIEGFLKGNSKLLSEKEIAPFRNQGGFDLIGTGRGKIETKEQLEIALKTCACEKLDGLVIIGGDDSNTNAAILAEYFKEHGCDTRVVGIPKTIDGDLRSKDIEISFGFDTACKTYSELIGNIARDALSSKKYYHFIKLMGRSASHVCLECALAIHPNLTLISEEKKSLNQIVKEIADLICLRSDKGREYGIILIPEGLIEFIPEVEALIKELNCLIQKGIRSVESVIENLKEPYKALFLGFSFKIQKQLLFDRDPHGNIGISQIDTEQLLIERVSKELKTRADYKGKFAPQNHFFGYEGRSCFPSNFDANYCYSLGLIAIAAIRDRLTGILCSVQKLASPVEKWEAKAVPIVNLMRLELRNGKQKPVIEKKLVEINEGPFVKYSCLRKSWELDDQYLYPGPIQFFGDRSLTDSVPITLAMM